PRSSRLGGAGESISGARFNERDERENRRSQLVELFGTGSLGTLGLDGLTREALRNPSPIARRLAFGKLLESMTVENAGEIREHLLAHGADGREWDDFHYSWGAIAGREALELAAASEEEDLSAVMSGWAAANPAEAMAMLDDLPDGMEGSRVQLAESLIAGLADHDLGMATEMALQLSAEGTVRGDRAIRSVAQEALRLGGAVEAATWAEALEDGPVKGAALDRVAGAYVRDDPEAAADWVSRFAEDDYAASAVAEVGEEWGEEDPTAAIGWLESLPEGSGQTRGFNSVLGEWEDQDPVAASEYLAEMAPSPQRDAAVSGFARGYARQDPEVAVAWASDISDPQLRQQSLTQVGRAYFRRDPEGARSWLETTDLPAEAREQITSGRRR
ncbi:MAG: hypothetical protein ACQKBU_04740, partial [Verrucomicrobiales bacterium]